MSTIINDPMIKIKLKRRCGCGDMYKVQGNFRKCINCRTEELLIYNTRQLKINRKHNNQRNFEESFEGELRQFKNIVE